MKEIHLICNAHIDPIWQWTEDEGIFAAISTFRSAVSLAREFDYIFCHNEVVLYRAIEKYDPELFDEIRELVKKGKWHIMGGWYLQPDCNMPSGESFIRQILVGRQYFYEKFGVCPTTAVNLDPFGHTKGLVQIMTKCGQDSYLITRPKEYECPVGADQFIWEGFDGSTVKVTKKLSYGTPLGKSVSAIKEKIKASENEDTVCVMWGVGNHGGGPSRKDLADIAEFIKTSDMKVLHSTPEYYFARINPEKVFTESLIISMPGCYTSMNSVKKRHIELENILYFTEKICSVASIRGLMKYPEQEINSAVRDLLTVEFHDVLPGTVVKSGEENAIRCIDRATQTLIDLRTHALYALSKEEKPAPEGSYPVLVFNPHPYTLKTPVTVEFMLADQNWDSETETVITVKTSDGQCLPSQCVKEESNLNLDWRKRIVFEAELKPMGITRFDAFPEVVTVGKREVNNSLHYRDSEKEILIDDKTGLVKKLAFNGTDILSGSITPLLFDDNADPWAMAEAQLSGLGSNPVPFTLCKEPDGVFRGLRPIQVTEDGEILRKTECFFENGLNRLRTEYTIYKKHPYIDLHIDVFGNEKEKMLKLAIPLAVRGKFIGGTAFGTEGLFEDGRECVSQRFVGIEGACGFAILDNCRYGSSYKDGVLYLSLLRYASYCTHPICDRPLYPDNKSVKWIDEGLRSFDFRIVPCAPADMPRLATEFNQREYALNVFPDGTKKPSDFSLVIENRNITLEAFKKAEGTDDYILHLYNGSPETVKTALALMKSETELTFGKYEIKTVTFKDGILREESSILI